MSRLTREQWAKLAAYESPFSGQGVEFHSLGAKAYEAETVLHEAGFCSKRPYWNYQRVFSPFWRLYYDLEPGHSVVFDDRQVVLGPGKVVLIPDNQLFHTVGTKPKAKFWLAFSHARRAVADQSMPIELRVSRPEKALMMEMTNLLWSPIDRERIYHSSLALLHLVLSRPEIKWQADTPQDLQTVIRHVEQHFSSPLYIATLARLAHMSETTFRKQFKSYLHVSPAQFIAQVRVREARHLLSTTTLDIPQIADRTGFPNAAYFSRVFRHLTGRTPGHSRRE